MSPTPLVKTPDTKIKQYPFIYECTNPQGTKLKGELNSTNIAFAKAELRRQGLTPIKIKRKPKPLLNFKQKIVPADICTFSRQMATMMKAGIPLVQSFDIVARGSENRSLQELVLSIKSDVEDGRSFSDALRKNPLYFTPLFCNLVAAGEASGALDTLLERIATYLEKSESLKRKIKKALFYPTAVMVVAVIVTAILLIFVVPQFQKLFDGFGAKLPAFTLMVIGLSNLMKNNWFFLLAGLFASIWGFTQAKRRFITFQHFLDRLSLRLPIVGNILNKAAIARYARTLSTTFTAGVPLVESLESVAGASGNIVYYQAIMHIREEVSAGGQIQAAMKNTGIFPNLVVQMVAIGEESGSLDTMLGKVADIYEEEVDAAVDGLSSLLEPLIMAILGVLVGGLVIAMYLPIFKMGSVI